MKRKINTAPWINKTWETICTSARVLHGEDHRINFDITKREIYASKFKETYNKILKYMEENSLTLDRHKVSAIIIVATLAADVLTVTENEGDKKFMGNYIIATEVALSYMLGELNEFLKEKGQKPIERFFFPEAFSCKTKYFSIFYRNLYYACEEPEWSLNPLDIADRLFLLEYMTLVQNGIDPGLLKEY